MTCQNNKEVESNWSLYRHITPSGKIYIGITSQNPYYRWNNGRGYFGTKNSPFKNSIMKYGWDNIKHEILFTNLEENRAKRLEIELIRHYKSLGNSLNLTEGGEGVKGITPWNKGIKVPYEKSNKRKGIPLSEEHKQKLRKPHNGNSGWRKGIKMSEDTKEKLRLINKGRKRPIEERLKISLNSPKKLSISELDNFGNIINKFNSIAEAANLYSIDSSYIARCCKKNIICKGHIFIYSNLDIDCKTINIVKHKKGFHFTFDGLNVRR